METLFEHLRRRRGEDSPDARSRQVSIDRFRDAIRDRYLVEEEVGRGGMATVHKAWDPRHERRVAIKILRPDLRDAFGTERFLREIRITARLQHPNILTLIDSGELDGVPYYVMPFVEGESLERRLHQGGAIDPRETVRIVRLVAGALDHAHRSGIIHRDVKPSNILLSEGEPMIMDFGIARALQSAVDEKLTAVGVMVGTPAYMSPEQLQGDDTVDARSDTYSLGCVLYEMLAGELAFTASSMVALIAQRLEKTTLSPREKNPEVPPWLDAVVIEATQHDRRKRFRTAADFAAALEGPDGAGHQSGFASSQRHASPKRWVIPALAGIAVVTVLGWGLTQWSSREPSDGRNASALGPGSRQTGVALPGGRIGVAVLPIQDLSGDPELERAGIDRILANAFVQILSDSEGLYVISPQRLEAVASSLGRSFRDAASDHDLVHQIGERVSAQVALSGTLSRLEETYLLNAMLTDIESGEVLETIEVQSTRPGRLIAELAGGVSEEIVEKYSRGADDASPVDVERFATVSMEAYEHYIRGDDALDEGDWGEAVRHLEQSVQIDPDMALAWSALSCAYSFAGDSIQAKSANLRAAERSDRVNEAEKRWIELDSIWVNTGNGDRYLAAMQKYIDDFPDHRRSYYFAGLAMEHLKGSPQGAIDWYERAYSLTPEYYPVTKTLAGCYEKLGRKEEAIRSLERYLALPNIGDSERILVTNQLERVKEGS